ncbi:ComEC/Rec2 family competence protein [Amycolatopsis azurea]|uniref:Competence protein n=1 Tax=Amycolatopsis azurea DSM 43854 TaxID=1238180 RepID=M2Q2L9_9PSEU|nr:ComEC/Rec2 family competence protein [Amycolatopsis azurea]EMD26215.1 competence protein [Amycolatopsis azurea DSM 43854]OOC01459.1 competence protein ComEC [Amycolatopsis azurea DSM 43854]
MNPSADPSEVDTASWRGQDLRLLPAAVTAWLGTLSGLLAGWWITMLCGAAAVVLAIIAGVRARRTASRWVAGLGALAVVGVLTAGPVALRIRAAEHDDLRAAAARGSDATARVVVTERPRPVRGAGYADRQAGTRLVVVAATVDTVVTGERVVDSAGRILLLAPAEGWLDLLPGQQVTTSGRLAPAKGAELTVAVLSVWGPPSALSPAPWWQRAAESLRTGLRSLCSVLPEEQAGLVPGLVVGDTSTLSPRVEREFTDSGMSHLMAVSGGNVAIVCGSILLLLKVLRVGPRTSAAAAAAGLAGFVVLAGPAPSVLRAGVMGAVGLLALALGRRGSALPALAFAVSGLVVADPAMAADFGFALSVLATAGLVLLAPRWAEWLVGRGVPAGYAEGLAIPLAAFVMTAPIIAGMAGSVSLVSVVTNVLAAPVVAPATVFGVLATVVGPWWPSAGRLLVRLTEPEASWLITVARHGARAPGAVVDWPDGWWGGLLAAGLLVVLLVAIRLRRARILLAVALAGGLLVFVPVRVLAPAWPPASWSAVACDVGQGDAVALATGEPGRAVLVDTGPEPGPVDECLSRLGVDRVPLIVLSHLHADHIGGLESVFEGRSVGAVAVGPGRAPAWAWQQVAEETARRGIPLLELGIGQRLDWPGLSLDVLGPRYVTRRSVHEQDGTVINNGSVVLRAGTPAGRLLLTGDVELAAQADLMAEGTDLRAEILKVPHHGSRYTAPDFLNAVAPRVALVSVGAGNTYGHPNKSTLDNLTAVGAAVARTDMDGDTAVVTDARGLALVRRGEPRGPPRS